MREPTMTTSDELDNFLPQAWGEVLMEDMKQQAVLTRILFNQAFVDAVEEYQTLKWWNIFKRRKLEKRIIRGAKYYLEDIEKIKNKGSIIKIPRFKDLKV